MLIWGWGRKSRSRQVNAAEALLVNFAYFSLFFVFTVTWGARYALARVQEDGAVSYRDLTPEQAMAAAQGGELPAPTPWQRFSLLGLLVAVVLAVGIGAALSTS
ncbi:hypothetical protein [Phycicoccus sonneratiae]|uniref:Uncharacterized protein n=1 Tax=Phycicoccus sonneratiae TaxID=2807628 RepID=A0ABS2CQ57_9MICO|nr:hypothetical protein [Phycicoccus sonneraticus]MBM6402018.1 hypothetical protein [Phycicoccus sonneraticus]